MITLKDWCREFAACKTGPMSDVESRMFMEMFFGERADGEINPMPKDMRGMLPVAIAEKRAAYFGLSITPMCLLFCAGVLAKNPAKVVMYMVFLRYLQVSKSLPIVDLSALSEAFPVGFPTKEEVERVWDLQKNKEPLEGHTLTHDNMLDRLKSEDFTAL